jgi:hypothetical protein
MQSGVSGAVFTDAELSSQQKLDLASRHPVG